MTRQEKIETLKKAIREGRYTIDSQQLADAIIRRARKRLASR